ncbi:hypothetical protein Trydic_g23049 [Trypoxylus dichotomus]
MDSLEKTYARSGVSEQIELKRKLNNMKFKSGPLTGYFEEFDRVVTELANAASNLNDQEIVTILLSGIPRSATKSVTRGVCPQNNTNESWKSGGFQTQGVASKSATSSITQRDTPPSTAHVEAEENDEIAFACNSENSWENSRKAAQHEFIPTVEFLVDSGSSDHLINDDTHRTEVEELQNPIIIQVAKEGESLLAIKKVSYIIFAKIRDLRVENTVPYCPFQNGKSEKLNRIIIENGRTLIAEYSLDHELWGEAVVYTATYIINRIPTVEDIIPAEKWLGENAKLKTFGCTAYDLIPSEKRAGKFDEKSKKMIFVGYTTNGFRLWDPDSRKIVRSRHVVFDESLPVKRLNLTTPAAESKENISEVINPEDNNLETVQNDTVQQGEEPNEQVTQKRERKPPNWHKDYDTLAHYAFNAAE